MKIIYYMCIYFKNINTFWHIKNTEYTIDFVKSINNIHNFDDIELTTNKYKNAKVKNILK